MPTYEYACKSCGERLEVVQSFSDDALTDCPACEGGELRKVFSAAGIIFKGDGWHVKDYASKSSSSSTTAAPSSGDGAGSGSSSSSESSSTATSSSSSSSTSGSGTSSSSAAASD